ncbi:hypothetical protein NC651_024373 [Populus alba x Populus x berolinensis]|nr:hypothetical protein NC651_024373 [Populus alba x Populus x berolinensis]
MKLAIIHLFVSFLLFLLIVHVNFWIGPHNSQECSAPIEF